jgi:hypothetical protein
MFNKEPLLNGLFEEYGLSEVEQNRIIRDLARIKSKDSQTYYHSLRTTLLAMEIAKHFGLDPKPLLFAGPRHDFGKINTPDHILKKKGNFTHEDHLKMGPHPADMFHHVHPTNAFTAQIGVSHHRHQLNPYPKKLPKGEVKLTHKAKLLANKYSKHLALADWLDAALFRKNSRFAGQALTVDLLKSTMLHDMPKLKSMIEKIFADGIVNEKLIAFGQHDSTTWQKRLARQEQKLAVGKRRTVFKGAQCR